MLEQPDTDLVVLGFADPVGTEAYNEDLSLRRANNVAMALNSILGAPVVRVTEEVKGGGVTREKQEFAIIGDYDSTETMFLDFSPNNYAMFPMGATGAEVEEAINDALGAGVVSVAKLGEGRWEVEWQSFGDQPAMMGRSDRIWTSGLGEKPARTDVSDSDAEALVLFPTGR